MMITLPSDWLPVAFKEWQLVSDALVLGEQSVILRKGGISEGKLGFQWQHDRFFLFPSLFHEQVEQVKLLPDGSSRPVPSSHCPEGEVAFSVFIETLQTGRLTDWGEVMRLDPFHIWTEETVRKRFDWGEEPGISFAVVRAYQLIEPWILADRESFRGCRSWIDLPGEENGGYRKRLETAIEIDPSCGLPD